MKTKRKEHTKKGNYYNNELGEEEEVEEQRMFLPTAKDCLPLAVDGSTVLEGKAFNEVLENPPWH